MPLSNPCHAYTTHHWNTTPSLYLTRSHVSLYYYRVTIPLHCTALTLQLVSARYSSVVAALLSPSDAPTGCLLAGRRPPSAAGKCKCRCGTRRVAATPCFALGTSDAPAAPAAAASAGAPAASAVLAALDAGSLLRLRRPRNRACRVAAAPCSLVAPAALPMPTAPSVVPAECLPVR